MNHTEHHRMMIKDFRNRFYFSLVLTLPILALTPLVQNIIGIDWTFPGAGYVVFVLATILYFVGGWPFLSGLVQELKDKNPGMMTLIGMAITVAYGYSTAVTFGLPGMPFYWELATLIAIMLAGHWIEMASVVGASAALEKLARLMPSTAHKKEGDVIQDIPSEQIQDGDFLVVKPGEKIPADGHITEGESYVDESMLTGESRPVHRKQGDKLIGGSINGDGSFTLEVEGVGENAYLSKIIQMVQSAQEAKSKTQKLSDRAAKYLTIGALTVGIVTLVTWLLVGFDVQFAITRMATVMIITCPHALGLAIPLVVSVSTAKSAQNGLLIQNRTAFEQARNINAIVFDKTGTLTEGTFTVTDVTSQKPEKDIVQLAASLETYSEHPIGKSIVAYAKEQSIELVPVEDAKAIQGKGISGTIKGSKILVASPSHVREIGIEVPPSDDEKAVTRVFVLSDEKLIGSITLSDTIREQSYKAISSLQKMGITCWMLTGDNEATARAVSKELGMDGYFAEVLPDEKQSKIKELQNKGLFVAMTGDGVNDSPALAQANVGIAIGSGTDVAASTADIILVHSNPRDIVTLIRFGKVTYRKMIQNLVWATAYNLLAIPLAAGVLYSVGFVLQPEVGAILMTLSTVIVAVNARLLKIPKETE
ncbi:MAG: P-type Cu2+ transporter [Sphaerochaeta sp.]|jgi:Cu2+-exporting ATPase|uniref:Copper-translocating P-type ATPase n=1 Tax=Sphaerochaeta halotolerans TaxID=2293840 RepID=A0A372MJJ7_9SPIR|nr:copper-translocating P-type ATPase [Sphaerochaeta halotolerans]MBG0767523.1 copper-translocating P-type ATPase [Spirochaetaceae bacterium]MDK2860247.1 P-type Cu2+ transporter [Sphaerochaeta sp.]MDN5334445.1 P-type Cu2+ transporter [Sphaerochaeta sp.]RFU95977.1 copper-translocating P-type ATPase [Sphaerochaeta halotolerans]